jgi:hypothetical protein
VQPADVLPPPVVEAEAARDVVRSVLARPEYAGLEPSWWDRIVAAVRRAVGTLLGDLGTGAAGSVIGWLVVAALALGVGWLVYRWVRSLRRDAVAGLATEADVGRSPAEWITDAEGHEAQGRFRDAVRCRYRALVADLAEGGRLEEIPGRTAGEYLTALRAEDPAAAEPFAAATSIFERAWYGSEEVGADDVTAMRERAGETAGAAGLRRGATVGAGTGERP